MAQLMPLPLTVSCFSKIQIGFTFLVPAHLGSPGKRPLNGCVCVCVVLHKMKIKYRKKHFIHGFELSVFASAGVGLLVLSLGQRLET